jgi:hypothetical protein
MKLLHATIAAAALFGSLAWFAPAMAAPPTVTPSPGYDARLAEQRAGVGARPLVREARPASRRHNRRVRGY